MFPPVFHPITPHAPPPPRVERDLLSCKHIGSSIENGLTKSIKADIIPGIRGCRREGGGGGGRELAWLKEGILPAFSTPPLSRIFSSSSFLLVCHPCPLFLTTSLNFSSPLFSNHSLFPSSTPPPPLFLVPFLFMCCAVDSQSNDFNRPTCRAA